MVNWKEMKDIFWRTFRGVVVICFSFVAGIMTMVGINSDGIIQTRIKWIVCFFLVCTFLLQTYKDIFKIAKTIKRSEIKDE